MSRLLVVGVRERRRGWPTADTLSDGSLEAGGLGNMRLFKVLGGVLELIALLVITKQFHHLLASPYVLRFRLSYPAFLLLNLAGDRTERVLRPFVLVFLLCLFGPEVPYLVFVVTKAPPGHTDDLGERAVVRLDLGGAC